jgi:high-affinity Fe2+/Pb2+ permease
MKHPQAFVLLLLATAVAFAFALWSGSLWISLGVLISGFALAFVVSMAWLWSPKSGINSKRKPSRDSLSGVL